MLDAATPQAPTARAASRRRAWPLAAALLAALALALLYLGWRRTPAPPAAGRVDLPALAQDSIRLATFNIRSGRGNDGRRDLARTASLLRDFDLVALNEVDATWGGAHDAETLARTLGMTALFAPSERRWWRPDFGNAALLRHAAAWKRIPLHGTQPAGHRNALLLDLGRIRVLLTHLDRTRDRAAQLDAVFTLFASLDPPAVLMGDLNTRADDADLLDRVRRVGASDAVAAARRDDAVVDHIFVRGAAARSAGVTANDASDHPVVHAVLEWTP